MSWHVPSPDSRFQKAVDRAVGRSKVSYLIAAFGMAALSATILYVSATGQDDGQRYEGWGWFVGPIGILFFGFCFIRGFGLKTDTDGRVLRPDGEPLAKD